MCVHALGYEVLRTETLRAHLELCRESITTNGSPFKVCFSSAGNMVTDLFFSLQKVCLFLSVDE